MSFIRKRFSLLLVILLSAGIGYFGNEMIRYRNFIKAEADVKVARARLENVGDLAVAFREVCKVVSPSVVNINVRKAAVARKLNDEDFRKFHELPDDAPVPRGNDSDRGGFEQLGTGSGVIMEAGNGKAWILTNNHVAGGADEMLITLADGREITDAVLVGADSKTDLAVVRINTDKVVAAHWGKSNELEKGDLVMAFGSPFGYDGSMTHGIVSALNRQAGILGTQGYESFIQVDAPINPGNSGGPLTDLKGNVVGINTAIASRSGGFQGVGFAIPSKQAKVIFDTLKDKGKVIRGWLGIGISDVSRDRPRVQTFGFTGEKGIVVNEVFRGSPAANKLQPGDIITQINGNKVNDVQELRGTVASFAPGTDVKMTVFRDKQTADVVITLGEQPEKLAALSQRDVMPRLPSSGSAPSLESIGIMLADVSEELTKQFDLGDIKQGAVVTRVDPDSPAGIDGLHPGDVITRVGDAKIASAAEFSAAIKSADLKKGIAMTAATREGTRSVMLKSEK